MEGCLSVLLHVHDMCVSVGVRMPWCPLEVRGKPLVLALASHSVERSSLVHCYVNQASWPEEALRFPLFLLLPPSGQELYTWILEESVFLCICVNSRDLKSSCQVCMASLSVC